MLPGVDGSYPMRGLPTEINTRPACYVSNNHNIQRKDKTMARRISDALRTATLDLILKEIQKGTGEKYVKEYRFDSKRKWRFDVAFPGVKLAVEIEGCVWGYGRHNRAAGFLKDMEKYNKATEDCWGILRYTWDEVENGTMKEQVIDAIWNRQNIISYRVG